MTTILSMGGGVNTTALLLMNPKKYDYVIFSDTHDERAYTYEYIEDYLKPFCKTQGVPWITVEAGGLENYCLSHKMQPSTDIRWCTADHKIRPIRRWIRKNLFATRKNPVYEDLGIAIDEKGRLGGEDGINKAYEKNKWDVQYLIKKYPLIEQKIDRERCIEIINEHGFPNPGKSGCWHCPFRPMQDFVYMYRTDPKLYWRVVKIEENGKNFPERTLKQGFKMRSISKMTFMDEYFENPKSVPEMYEDPSFAFGCESGHCFG